MVGFFLGTASVLILVCGIGLFALGALAAAVQLAPSDWLQVGPDSISGWHGRQQLWQLRWQHMAEVRFAPEGIQLVPLESVAEHPEIAPALEPRSIDGVVAAHLELQIGPEEKTLRAARAAITQHAPPQLLAQSSPRPPST